MRSGIIVAGALCVVLADTGLWLAGNAALNAEAAGWAKQADAHGWTVSWARQASGGWPFVARLALERPSIVGGARYLPGGLAWSADRMVVSVSIAHPLTLRMAAEGQQFLRVGHAPDIGFVAGATIARLPLGWGHHGRATLALTDVTGGIAGSRYPQDVQLGAASLSIQTDQHEAEANPMRTARLTLQARSIGLPDIGRWPLGATIAGVDADVLMQSPLPAPIRPDMDRDGLQATTWRDRGGTLAVQHASLRWGPLGVSGSAKFGLDGRLQPAGSGTADAAGTAPTLDALAQAGLVAPGLALTAKAVLAVMTHVQGPDGDAVRLPFLLRNSIVSVGEVPVARMPDIHW